jgi:hypothetical protein
MTDEGYVIITGDWSQKASRGKKAEEIALYREHKAIAFWLPRSFSGNRKKSKLPCLDTKYKQAAFLIQCWPDILYEAGRASPGDLFNIRDNGKIEPVPPTV